MKVQIKDDIIKTLIDKLERDAEIILNNKGKNPSQVLDEREFLLNKGWIEALKWVLNLGREECQTVNISDINKEIAKDWQKDVGTKS